MKQARAIRTAPSLCTDGPLPSEWQGPDKHIISAVPRGFKRVLRHKKSLGFLTSKYK